MIFETQYWKRDLRRIAQELAARSQQRVWREASYARLEREIMVGFYAVRKLGESHRLNEEFLATQVPLVSFPSLGGHIGYFVWPEVEKHFDLAKPTAVTRQIEFVCNQVVHSWVFSPWFDKSGKLAGVFFSSDKKKKNEVYRLDLQRAIDIFSRCWQSAKGLAPCRAGPQ